MNAIISSAVTNYIVRHNHTVRSTHWMSAAQHAHYRGKLRPADEE